MYVPIYRSIYLSACLSFDHYAYLDKHVLLLSWRITNDLEIFPEYVKDSSVVAHRRGVDAVVSWVGTDGRSCGANPRQGGEGVLFAGRSQSTC